MSDWHAGYEMGCQHGYEMATAELLRILRDRMKAGEDILPMLPLIDDLRERQSATLQRRTSA